MHVQAKYEMQLINLYLCSTWWYKFFPLPPLGSWELSSNIEFNMMKSQLAYLCTGDTRSGSYSTTTIDQTLPMCWVQGSALHRHYLNQLCLFCITL